MSERLHLFKCLFTPVRSGYEWWYGTYFTVKAKLSETEEDIRMDCCQNLKESTRTCSDESCVLASPCLTF